MDAKHVARRGGERSLGRRTSVETSSRARTRRRRGTGPLREDTLEGHRGARACVSIGKFSDANVCEERASRYPRTHVSNGGSMDTRRTARPLPCDGCCTWGWIVDEQQAPPMASMRPEGLEMRTPRCQGTNARGVHVPMASTSASRAPKRLVSTIGGTTIVPFPCTFPSIPSHRGPQKDSRNRGPNTVHPRRVFHRTERARMHSFQRRQGRTIPCATMESDRPDTFAFRVGTATFTSLLAGSLVGALTATWKVRGRDVETRRWTKDAGQALTDVMGWMRCRTCRQWRGTKPGQPLSRRDALWERTPRSSQL